MFTLSSIRYRGLSTLFVTWSPLAYGQVLPFPEGNRLAALLKRGNNSSKFYHIGPCMGTKPITKSSVWNISVILHFEVSTISVSLSTTKSATRANHQLWAQTSDYTLSIIQPQQSLTP